LTQPEIPPREPYTPSAPGGQGKKAEFTTKNTKNTEKRQEFHQLFHFLTGPHVLTIGGVSGSIRRQRGLPGSVGTVHPPDPLLPRNLFQAGVLTMAEKESKQSSNIVWVVLAGFLGLFALGSPKPSGEKYASRAGQE